MRKKKQLGGILGSPAAESLLSSLLSILMGLVIGLIILLICNAETAFPAIKTIATGGFGLSGFPKTMGRICYYAVPLIMCGLSVGFAFKTGTFNIGASGQYVAGAFTAILVTHLIGGVTGSFTWIIAILAGAVAGGIVGMIPGLLSAYRNVNIIISGLMMNFIATYGVSFLIKKIDLIYSAQKSTTQSIPSELVLPKVGLDKLFPVGGSGTAGANIGILIAIAMGVVVYIVLNRTVFGFELRTCGANRFAAKNAGIKENRAIVISMFIAGALAGIGGGLVYLSSSGINLGVTDTVDGTGFYGIAVALLGQLNPIGIVAAGALISYFQVGGSSLQIFGFSAELIDVIVAAIIFCCAFAQRFGSVIRAGIASRRQAGGAPSGDQTLQETASAQESKEEAEQ